MSSLDQLEIGLCSQTFADRDLPRLIEAAARHGFPTITTSASSIVAAREGGLGEAALRRRLADARVRIRIIDGLIPDLPRTAAMAALARTDEATCFAIAETLDTTILNLALYALAPLPMEELAETVAAMAERAAARGIDLVIEFVPDYIIPDIATTRDLLRAVGAANCRMLVDPWHFARSGATIADLAALPPAMIGALQLCDWTALPPGMAYPPMDGRRLPGEGELPLHDLVRTVIANNPAITAEIEIFSDELRALSLDEGARRIAEAVRRWRAGAWSGSPSD